MKASYSTRHERDFGVIAKSLDPFRLNGETMETAIVRVLHRMRLAVGRDRFNELISESIDYKDEEKEEEGIRRCTVKFFLNGENNYGFTDDGVFFHRDRGIEVGCNGGNEPALISESVEAPKKGATIVLQAVQARRGLAAKWWTYASMWDAAQNAIAERPTIRLFDKVLNITLWKGQDIDKLRFMYDPAKTDRRLWSPERFVFEEYRIVDREAGILEWVKVEDPR